MSRLSVYDNWGKLVGAVINRERLQRLAFCDSLSSSPSSVATISPLSNVSSSSHLNFYYAAASNEQVTGSVKDVLEEVKERLRSELQGKSDYRASTVRGLGIVTPYNEMPSEPRQIAQRIAQEISDSVRRDLGMNSHGAKSTRIHQRDIHLVTGLMHPDYYRKRRARAGNSRDVHLDGYPGSITTWLEKQNSSRRHHLRAGKLSLRDLSPTDLNRSLSAPPPGTSFSKLLLQDRNTLTGAQIRRKDEVIKKVSQNAKKIKGRFNIMEKVSSFRYSLTHRFRRRVQLIEGSKSNKNDLSRDISSGPTIMKSFYTHENSTEVPPSPASVFSSVHEDFWRPTDYLSRASSSGIHHMEDYKMPRDFSKINSNLSELRRKLSQLEGAVPAETIIDEQPTEAELDLEDEAQAYTRDLLVASGLYNGSCIISLSKWDPLGKPISNQVFEEVEESYRKTDKDNDACKQDKEETLNHRLLLALLNETLPAILEPSTNMSRYMQKAIGSVHERKLLFRVWQTIKSYVHPPADRFYFDINNLSARDLKRDSWYGSIDDYIVALGRDLECQIIGDMLEEIVTDFLE